MLIESTAKPIESHEGRRTLQDVEMQHSVPVIALASMHANVQLAIAHQ
jgi:hypothetical protein